MLEVHPVILHAKYVLGISQRMLSKTQSCHMFWAVILGMFQYGDCASCAHCYYIVENKYPVLLHSGFEFLNDVCV